MTSIADTTAQLQQLLAPPSEELSQQHAQQLLASSIPAPLTPSKLGNFLGPLLASEEAKAALLSSQLAQSTATTSKLLATTKQQLAAILARTTELRSNHEGLEDALIDHREALVSSLAQREQAADGTTEGATLRERLEVFSQRRKELEVAKQWFAVLVKAEELRSALQNTGVTRES